MSSLLFWLPGFIMLLTLIGAFTALQQKKGCLYLQALYASYFSGGTSLLLLWDAMFIRGSAFWGFAFIIVPGFIIFTTGIGFGLGVRRTIRKPYLMKKFSALLVIPPLLMFILLLYGLFTTMDIYFSTNG